MTLKDADKAAKKLSALLDKDCRINGTRNSGDFISVGEQIEYFDLRDIIEAYQALRGHQKRIRKVIATIKEAGKEIDWYSLDKL